MAENICYKFGTPHSADLQKLQEICLDINATNIHFQKFLLFIVAAFSLFLILVFFAKFITPNKKFIDAYYKSSFTYFMQVFTVITIIPILLFFLDGEFAIISQITVTFGVLGMIFIIFEFWPTYKKDVEVNNSIISTLLITLFILSFYHMYNSNIKDQLFIDTALVSIFILYLIILNIFIKLIIEVKRKSYKENLSV